MQLAHSGLVNTKHDQKTQKSDWTYAENLQEGCFYRGKSPCGMQRARQGLVKCISDKIQSQISISGANPIEIYIKWGFGDYGGEVGG